jgi:hypothetical protein
MEAKPITYQGIQFRSKLECRHYNFMKRIGWNIEYEPEVELFSDTENGYGGCSHSAERYFIEVKPIRSQSEFYSDKYKFFRDKVYKSGILKKGILFIVGSNLKLRTNVNGRRGENIFVYAFRMLEENQINSKEHRNYSLCSFSGCCEGNYEGIGLTESWNDCRNDWIKKRKDSKYDYYDVCDHNLSREGWNASEDNIKTSMFIERSWNEAWSKMQWRADY